MNQFLTQQVPNWREHIDPIEPKKASWVTPTVNALANDVMTGINKSALLNPVAIVALILLSQENKALPKTELIKQFDFLLNLQREAPYSEHLYVPEESGERQINDVIALNKVNVEDDSFGQIISLTPSRALELTYYRNNILKQLYNENFSSIIWHYRCRDAHLIQNNIYREIIFGNDTKYINTYNESTSYS